MRRLSEAWRGNKTMFIVIIIIMLMLGIFCCGMSFAKTDDKRRELFYISVGIWFGGSIVMLSL